MKHVIVKFFVVFATMMSVFLFITVPSFPTFLGMVFVPAGYFTGLYVISALAGLSAFTWEYANRNPGKFSIARDADARVEKAVSKVLSKKTAKKAAAK